MHSKTIAQLAQGLRDKSFSSEELTAAYLERIEKHFRGPACGGSAANASRSESRKSSFKSGFKHLTSISE